MLNFIRNLFRRHSGTIAVGPDSLHFGTTCYKCGSKGEANFKVTPAMRTAVRGSTFTFNCLDCGEKNYIPVDQLLAYHT